MKQIVPCLSHPNLPWLKISTSLNQPVLSYSSNRPNSKNIWTVLSLIVGLRASSVSDGGYHQMMNDGIYLIRNGRIMLYLPSSLVVTALYSISPALKHQVWVAVNNKDTIYTPITLRRERQSCKFTYHPPVYCVEASELTEINPVVLHGQFVHPQSWLHDTGHNLKPKLGVLI